MKKVWILIIIVLLTGCNKNNDNEYYLLVDELKTIETSTIDIPFDINISLDTITDDEIMYNIIVDNPKEDTFDVKVLAIHDKTTKDIYPSIGIYDKKVNLIPNEVNEKKNNVKGIALVGYFPFEGEIEDYRVTFKILIEYTDVNGNSQKVYFIHKI